MTQNQKANDFLALHKKADPVVLYNIWDAGSAKAVAEAGAKVIATGSWAMAGAHGFDDGQNMPLDLVLAVCERIIANTKLPVTVDFEGGYADDQNGIMQNVTRLMQAGAIGLNFEDQVVGGHGLYQATEQAERIAVVRSAIDAMGVPAVINARTDLFLKDNNTPTHEGMVKEAISRARIYKSAGADCFFIPGTNDVHLIRQICDAVSLPVNVMLMDTAADLTSMANTGVARISFGPAPYFAAMSSINNAASKYF